MTDYETGPDEFGPKRTVTIVPDDPGLDCTDAAHPAWWRGQDYGCEMTVAAINRVLDTLERGEPHGGHFAGAALEALKLRLEGLLLK
jgi:hypothetical protein